MPSAKSPAAITVTHKPSPSRSIAVRQPIHSRKVSSQEVKPPWSVERLAFCRNLSEKHGDFEQQCASGLGLQAVQGGGRLSCSQAGVYMRRLRYGVAMSLDGFIAGPNGEYDWIVPDPTIDFAAIWAQFDTVLMGRKTFEIAQTRRKMFSGSVQRWIVASRTLKPEDHPDTTILSSGVEQAVAALKDESGPQSQKDIWLFGGGELFRFLLDAGLVDAIDVMVMPVLLGSGVPFLPEGCRQTLHLENSKALASGILTLSYSIPPQPAAGEPKTPSSK